jgi:hypothetical protein
MQLLTPYSLRRGANQVIQNNSQKHSKPRFTSQTPPSTTTVLNDPQKEQVYREFNTLFMTPVLELYSQRQARPLSYVQPSAMYWTYEVKEPVVLLQVEDKPEFLAQLQDILEKLYPAGLMKKAGIVEQTNGKGNLSTEYEYKGLKMLISLCTLL